FKICRFLDAAQWVLTGHRAPWAWMGLECGFRYDPSTGGEFRLNMIGASIPTQYLYVDWHRVDGIDGCSHDMMGIQQADIHAFVEKGSCVPGPVRKGPCVHTGSF